VIFVTVGAQMPFDRLIIAIDNWAGKTGRKDIFAQIGLSDYQPQHIEWTKLLPPQEFKKKYESAKAIVAHAGTGSIITALQMGKPIVIMPRRANLRETRNDHQIATSEQFQRFDSVIVAWDEIELILKLENINNIHGSSLVGSSASSELINIISEFINSSDKTSLKSVGPK